MAAAQLVGKYGGSMSGEHGDGRARGELLPYMYSAAAIDAMGAVKAVFDPDNLLNPGVLVDPAPVDADLRLPLARPLRSRLGLRLPGTTAATCPSPCTAAPASASAGRTPPPPAG